METGRYEASAALENNVVHAQGVEQLGVGSTTPRGLSVKLSYPTNNISACSKPGKAIACRATNSYTALRGFLSVTAAHGVIGKSSLENASAFPAATNVRV
jgi:hypothetical protein